MMKAQIHIRQRLLIIGAGDIAYRAMPWLSVRFRVFALCRTAAQADRWRAAGAIPLRGDLDQPNSLKRLSGIAPYVLYSAPPATNGTDDVRLKHCLNRLSEAGIIPCRLVYIGTTGVYGDRRGDWVSEESRVRPESPRAHRRIAAEQHLRRWIRSSAHSMVVLRAPGIYAADRLPLERIRARLPALIAADDGYTNHIHAEDLARALGLALFRGGNGRVFNVADDSSLKMGDWFDQVAARFGLPPVERLPADQIRSTLSEMQWSFMRESRRVTNRRMKNELRLRLRYPTVEGGLKNAD